MRLQLFNGAGKNENDDMWCTVEYWESDGCYINQGITVSEEDFPLTDEQVLTLLPFLELVAVIDGMSTHEEPSPIALVAKNWVTTVSVRRNSPEAIEHHDAWGHVVFTWDTGDSVQFDADEVRGLLNFLRHTYTDNKISDGQLHARRKGVLPKEAD